MVDHAVELNRMLDLFFHLRHPCDEMLIAIYITRNFLHVAKRYDREHVGWNVEVEVACIIAWTEA
ncbi:hypothetical protein D3C73_1609880 [compost metagenome]